MEKRLQVQQYYFTGAMALDSKSNRKHFLNMLAKPNKCAIMRLMAELSR